MITFKIACASGVLVFGSSPDFLVCVARAKETKRYWSRVLPLSTLRVQFFYPNRKRVPSLDIKAALRALSDSFVSASVATRSRATVANAPARSEASPAAFASVARSSLASAVGCDFSQAGVVAPPDSPDLGNSVSSVSLFSKA